MGAPDADASESPAPGTSLVYDALASHRALDYHALVSRFVDPAAFHRIIVLCFDCTGEEMLEQWNSLIGDPVDDVAIIDVSQGDRRQGGIDRPDASAAVIQDVDAASGPDAVLDALRGYCGLFDAPTGPTLCLVDSLDPYVAEHSSDAVEAFVEAFAYHVRGVGAQGVVRIDDAADDWVRHALEASFDRVLRRSADGDVTVVRTLSTEPFSPDDEFDLLSPHRRRYLLHALALTLQHSVSIDDLVRWIARWDDDASADRRTRLHLLHTDLPKLERAGVVRFDEASELVEPLDRLEQLETELRHCARRDFGSDTA